MSLLLFDFLNCDDFKGAEFKTNPTYTDILNRIRVHLLVKQCLGKVKTLATANIVDNEYKKVFYEVLKRTAHHEYCLQYRFGQKNKVFEQRKIRSC